MEMHAIQSKHPMSSGCIVGYSEAILGRFLEKSWIGGDNPCSQRLSTKTRQGIRLLVCRLCWSALEIFDVFQNGC